MYSATFHEAVKRDHIQLCFKCYTGFAYAWFGDPPAELIQTNKKNNHIVQNF